MKDFLIAKEIEIDKYFENLPIWGYSYFTIYFGLCFHAEKIDIENNGDSAGDFFARMSTFHNKIVEFASSEEFGNSWSSLELTMGDENFKESISFLYSYGHFNFLMPQIHRNVFNISKTDNNEVLLSFKSKIYIQSEINDRFLSEISLPIAFGYRERESLERYLVKKVEDNIEPLNKSDLRWIDNIYQQYYSYNTRVEILSDQILLPYLGFQNSDFDKFEASIRACTDFLIYLSRTYKDLSLRGASIERKAELYDYYFEWCNCCLTYKFIDLLIEVSGLKKEVFMNILPYFVTIYSQPNEGNFKECSHLGEGFMPPLTLTQDRILFNSLITRNFLSFDNIIYSLNKKQPDLFNRWLSPDLEPTLLNQVNRIFSKFDKLLRKMNVNIRGGEIDYLLLSEDESVCLVFQAKATLSPVSSRTVERVQTRSLEGIKQLKHFRSFSEVEKLKVVNDTFGVNLNKVKFIDILLVRSCAGSEEIWNSAELIINYQLLCGLLGRKLRNDNPNFLNFVEEVRSYFSESLKISSPKLSEQNLIINDLTIKFPNIEYSDLGKIRLDLLRDSSSLRDYRKA